jgi:hydrogenase maturation protease
LESTESVKISDTVPVGEGIAVSNPGIAVIGIGNILLSDEGIGVHTVQQMMKQPNISEVEIIDAGTCADIMMLISDSVEHVIIIDAANGGGEPGDIYRFTPEDIDTTGSMVSLHENNLVAGIKMLPLYNRELKSIIILGIEPGTLESGLELSPEIAAKIPRLIELINREITNLIESMEDKR